MAGLDYSLPLLGAGAQVKTDWSSASARTSLQFNAAAQFRRGMNLEIGIEALASADVQFQQFLAATVRGNAFAEAHAQLQVQLPLNLFDEAGLCIGAEAAAQAAAGIEVGLGLSIGDFLRLAKADSEMAGLPLHLLTLLLEEVSVGGKVEVHVAAAAMAYASLKITGSVISRPGRAAGFEYVVDAGLGVAAGAGFRAGVFLEFKNFRRFYGRAIDSVVEETLGGLAPLLPSSPAFLREALFAFGPVAKTGLRVAYELGDYIAKNSPALNAREAANLANHCTGIVLEEAQRFLFDQTVSAGLKRLHQLLSSGATAFPQEWNLAKTEREALADLLVQVPAEPFGFSSENVLFWQKLTGAAVALVAKLPGTAGLIEPLTALYAASDLLLEMMRSKVEQASSYALAVGAGNVRAELPFNNQLAQQPAPALRNQINLTLGRAASQSLTRADLVRYLAHASVIALLRRSVPEVDAFLRVFKGPLAQTEEAVCQLLLSNRAAFVANAAGDMDPRASLRLLLTALDTFVSSVIKAQLAPALARTASTPEQRLYFNEVLLPTVLFIKDLAFDTVLNWDKRPLDRAAFTEALGSVLTMLLGRSLVIGADAFLFGVQSQMKAAFAHAAKNLSGPTSPFLALGLQRDDATVDLFTTALEVGGDVFGPLPPASRRRLRNVLYQVFETLPPSRQADFLTDLADQFFIPNSADLDEVRNELLAISRARFDLLLGSLADKFKAWLAEAANDLIDALKAALVEWERQLQQALARLFLQVQRLEAELQASIAATQDAFDDTTAKLHLVVSSLASDRVRDRLKDKIVEHFQSDALDLLRENPLYANLPFAELKKAARDTVKNVVRGLVGPVLVGPVVDALGAIAGQLSSLTRDLDDLDPREPLAAQLLELVLKQLDERLNALTPPSINVGFSLSFDFGGPQTIAFSLGRLSLPRANFRSFARGAITALDFYETQLNQAASAAKKWFDAVAAEQLARARHSAADANHRRLSKINSEHTATAKQIRILSPATQARVRGNAQARIELGGTPATYLGLADDEQQRVLILLNGTELSLSSAQVSPLSGRGLAGGLALSVPLPEASLSRGPNLLSVTVLDRGGRVLQEQVTFSYAPATTLLTPLPTVTAVSRLPNLHASVPPARLILAQPPLGLTTIRANAATAKKRATTQATVRATGLGKIAIAP